MYMTRKHTQIETQARAKNTMECVTTYVQIIAL